MNLNQLFMLVERLRKEAIGEPRWIEDKEVFEYQDHSTKVVSVLKLIRAHKALVRSICYVNMVSLLIWA